MKKIFSLITLFAICSISQTPAHAETYQGNTGLLANVSIVLPLASHHFQKSTAYKFNERNLGLGLEYKYSDHTDLTVGFYENSIYKKSVYLGAFYMPYEFRRVGMFTPRLGVLTGLVSGYRGGVRFAFLPALKLEGESFSINSTFIPHISKNVSSAVTLQVAYRF